MSPVGLPIPSLLELLVLAYAAVGVVAAAELHRRGQDAGTVLSAVIAWPVLVSALRPPEPTRHAPGAHADGPLGRRIDDALDALEATLRDPATGDIGGVEDTADLRTSLHRTDERLALVDRLLVDGGGVADPAVVDGLAALRVARTAAAAEVEAVLAGVLQLRIQIGLVTLAGNDLPVRARLRELRARIGALDEVTKLPGGSAWPTS